MESLLERHACYAYMMERVRDARRYTILMDEVHFMEGFEEVLNGLLHKGNVDVYVTGSNSKFLSSDIVTEFRGRGDAIRVYPLSFAECASARPDLEYAEVLEEYQTDGGLPMTVSFEDENKKADDVRNMLENVYLKDVMERHHLRHHQEVAIVVDVLASSIGSPVNPTKIAHTFHSEHKLSYDTKTVANHIAFFLEAFLLSQARRYNIKGRRYIGADSKDYFTDLGLRNARLGFRQQESTHLLENLVYNELLRRG